jgi:predicted transcriptional regulator
MQVSTNVFNSMVSAITKSVSNIDQKVFDFLAERPALEKHIAARLSVSSETLRQSLLRLIAIGSVFEFDNQTRKLGDRVYSRAEHKSTALEISQRTRASTHSLTTTQHLIVNLLTIQPLTITELCEEFGYKPSVMLKALKQMAKKNRYRQALVELQVTEAIDRWALINLEAIEN